MSTKEDTLTRLNGMVKGMVTYREGDGVMLKIPQGPCEMEIEDLDITLTWLDGDVHGSTAMPKSDFEQYVANGDLELE
jgi:hypothetical protein